MENEKTEISKLPVLQCNNCKKEIREGDELIIDANDFFYCSDRCLFEDYGQDYDEYLNREDQDSNFIDLGILDIKQGGPYNEGDLPVVERILTERKSLQIKSLEIKIKRILGEECRISVLPDEHFLDFETNFDYVSGGQLKEIENAISGTSYEIHSVGFNSRGMYFELVEVD